MNRLNSWAILKKVRNNSCYSSIHIHCATILTVGIRYVSGGIASAFKHVSINDAGPKRLFHVKGKRNVRVREVGVSVSNMNKGDCFILDNGTDIYVYVGPSSNGGERIKAVTAANNIRDQDHNGRSTVHICGT